MEGKVTDKEALIILNMISGIGSARLETLLAYFNSPSTIFDASISELKGLSGIGSALAEKICNWKNDLDFDKEMDIVEKGGVNIITRLDPEYPELLKEIYDPPICLYCRGKIPDLAFQSIAIVGSRRMSNYGRRMAKHFAESAAYAGWTVISGLAYGVDAVAHQACLNAGGKTVAVLGSGLARIHPQDHIPLARDIIENGAVISEFPMNFPANRQSFPRRNRIVSGLSRAALVVEAGLNSGALITAKIALEQNRNLYAIPGQADQPQSKGCHLLIKKDGAKLTETFDDIVEDFEYLPGFNLKNETANAEKEMQSETSLSEEEKKILAVLEENSDSSIEKIMSETALPVAKLLALLMQMEMKKLITQLPGRLYSRRK
jgi:DNA processing protein